VAAGSTPYVSRQLESRSLRPPESLHRGPNSPSEGSGGLPPRSGLTPRPFQRPRVAGATTGAWLASLRSTIRSTTSGVWGVI
jgi:hypothetical protein